MSTGSPDISRIAPFHQSVSPVVLQLRPLLGNVFETQQLRKNCFLLKGEKADCVVKLMKSDNVGLKQRLSRRVFGGSLSFTHEARVYRALENNGLTGHRVPQVLHMHAGQWIALEFLSGEPWAGPSSATDKEASEIGDIVYYVGTTPPPPPDRLPRRLLWWLLRSPLSRSLWIAVSNVRKRLGFWTMLRSLVLLTRLVLVQLWLEPRGRGCLIHNDLHTGNCKTSRSGNLRMLDFEVATWSSRWWLVNLVDAAWDGESTRLRGATVRSFMRLLRTHEPDCSEIVVKRQVRFAMIRRLGEALNRQDTPPELADQADHNYRQIVLSPSGFAEWWNVHREVFGYTSPE